MADKSIFIEGYFTDRILAGDRPNYHLTSKGLPPVPADASMEMEVLFPVLGEDDQPTKAPK